MRKIDWMGSVLYPLAVILMESFWVYPWLVWLGNWKMWHPPQAPLSLISIVVALALSLAATRYLGRKEEWNLGTVRAVIVVLGAVTIGVVLWLEYPPPAGISWFSHAGALLADTLHNPSTILLGLVGMLYLWWRGINLGGTTSYFRDIYRSFLLGMVALILLLVIWQVTSGGGTLEGPGTEIGWNVIGFFFFGLLAIAVCHLYNMRRAMAQEEASQTSVWRWLSIMLGVIGGMVLVGFGLAAIFSPEFFRSAGTALRAIGDFFGKVIDIIMIPLNYVFEALFWIINFFLNLLRETPTGEDATVNMSGGSPFDQVTTTELPLWLTEGIKWIVIILIIAIVVFILAKAFNRFLGGRRKADIEEIHESLWSMEGLKDDLKGLLNGLRDRMTVKRRPRRQALGDDLPGNLDIREIYRRILRDGAKAGLPRKPYETVEEYAYRIGRLVPEIVEPLEGLNGAYSDVRYGDTGLPDDKVKGANQLWAGLRAVLRRLRGES